MPPYDPHVNQTVEPEGSNRTQIERLNQRGGRMLSVVDLIEAGTLGLEMAACAWRSLHHGSSLLTGARPGGAGKTTVMAALLDFLPPGVAIATIEDAVSIAQAAGRPATEPRLYLAHEIGAGHWYGYIWGDEVPQFFDLVGGKKRVASCLHADTLEETVAILTAPPLGVAQQALDNVGLALFMWVDRFGGRMRRRVNGLYASSHGEPLELRFAWDRENDRFVRLPTSDTDSMEPYLGALRQIVARGEVAAPAVRAQVVDYYRQWAERSDAESSD